MRALLLGMAALAVALPAPAAAQSASDVRFSARSGSGTHGDFRHNDRRRDRRFDDAVAVGPWEWYEDYGARTWKSDSFNDWWHDRPDRAYPRWVINNQNCERKWWGGGTLRC